MSDTPQFITVEAARDTILAELHPLGTTRRTLHDALGRHLAEPVCAPLDAPAFDNSAMDGFAFAFGPARLLRVVGESAAGAPFERAVLDGEAIRIMTGAAVPAGCNTVAMREVCTVDGETLRVDWTGVSAGDHIRRRAAFMRAGEPVLAAGARLGAAEVGLLASFGRMVVTTHRTPRVGILTTGSELVEPDRPLGPGQIHNSNAYMLEALCREAGAEPLVAPIVPDDEHATRDALSDLAGCVDLLLTVGGVSVGDYDFVRQVLAELSGGMHFWKVRMKPGKPLAFGTLRPWNTPVIGLPGNPVSSFIGFHQFVRPALSALQGLPHEEIGPRRVRLRASVDIVSTSARREYVLGRLGTDAFVPHSNASSGNVLLMHRCTALGVVEEGVDHVPRGALLDVEIL